MILIDTKYNEKYESRRDCRRRVFSPDKSYLFYLNNDTFQNKQFAIFRDYNVDNDDFNIITGYSTIVDYGISIRRIIHSSDFRTVALSHSEIYDILVFEMTDAEIESQIYMEIL